MNSKKWVSSATWRAKSPYNADLPRASRAANRRYRSAVLVPLGLQGANLGEERHALPAPLCDVMFNRLLGGGGLFQTLRQ
jgi:hypothetical protein